MPAAALTPRIVPPVNLQAVKGTQSSRGNCEVDAILKVLKLDKRFFLDRLQTVALQELAPEPPSDEFAKALADPAMSGQDRQRESKRRNRRQLIPAKKLATDFDIYLGEAVMPVLAQCMDALCRQLARMESQGDMLDPEVRTRFNPLTWLGQQLLRRHPKCARTPRRAALYRSFKDWADWERGRREMLRRRDEVSNIFNGFMLRGVVQNKTLLSVVAAIDDTMCLQGALKDSVEILSALRGDFSFAGDPMLSARKHAEVDGLYFEEFWYRFGTAIMRHDVVPHSLLLRGHAQRLREEAEIAERCALREAAEAERRTEEAELRRLASEYEVLHGKLMINEHIISILEEQKILTGDDVREGDVGFEYEARPAGEHVVLLAEFLKLLGLLDVVPDCEADGDEAGGTVHSVHGAGCLRASKRAHAHERSPTEAHQMYWDESLAKAWAVLQRVHHAELADGVVDGAMLHQVLVPPVGFAMLRAKVEYEIERRQDGGGDIWDDEPGSPVLDSTNRKPSKEELCQRLGMTLARLDWLHKLFESYLQPDVDDPNAPPPCCLYPECPASLNKEQMRALIAEVEPNLGRAQFEAWFTRIDKDGSGLVEFDEFAGWVQSADVCVTGATDAGKMTFEELAARYQEPLELIEYLHSMFEDQLPDGVDCYPDDPVGLPKREACQLASLIIPSLNKKEFDESFDFVDQTSRQRGHCDFDEFIELLDLDKVPVELRRRYSEN